MTGKHVITRLALIVIVFFVTCSCAEIEAVLRELPSAGPAPLDENTIIAGLKEALIIGTENAAESLSEEGAFYLSEVFFIPLPEELVEVGDKLRQIGLGNQVDDFIETMNRGAERAAGEATEVFVGAIREMTISDARTILSGADNAATVYFEQKTRQPLYERFYPVAAAALDEVGVTRLYQSIEDTYNKIPFIKKKTYDLNDYVINKALDALFMRVAEEEKAIRTDPVARVNDLLRKVFGGTT